MTKKTIQYLIISYVWTWAFWLAAFFYSRTAGLSLVTDATVFDLFSKFPDPKAFLSQLLFALGVFGPLLGYLIAGPKKKGSFTGNVKPAFVVLALVIPIVTSIPGVLLSGFLGYSAESARSFGAVISTIAVYLLSNIVTSGTEEFGWRGFLYPAMRDWDTSFWRVAWKSGLLWAIWHYPFMFILYWGQGPGVLLPSLIGFTAGIIAMTYILNFIYEKSASIGLCMLLHALNNTASFAVLLLFPKSPFVFISSIMAWAVVAFLSKRYGADKKVQTH